MRNAPRSCSRCDARLVPDAAFCHRCGERVEGGAAPSVEPEECVVWVGRPCGRALAGWWLAALAWGGAVAFATAKFPAAHAATPVLPLVVALLPAACVLVALLRLRLRFRYRLTTHRLLVESGLLRTVLCEIPLREVTDISVRQGFVERIVNVGRVRVFSTTGGGMRADLVAVDHPLQVRETIRQLAGKR